MSSCKFFGHDLNFPFNDKLFCRKCGGHVKFDDSKPLFEKNQKGTSTFIEPVQFKDKFKKANNITDVLK